ncbi:Hpt domain-containing protein [Szabonella alba]|uniref:Hpt domain-containing protein n=1 Tax=Szabonella alba TaxID=2804194 RepID=A0A8K0VCQ6_9RHOB|nr:Hpt domain-containing protein [Szabonella alba]MBL4916887.1 Hpt domain-containing protein [Szabonella alba]
MIDWDRVAELRDEIGEEDFAEVATLFLDEADEAVAGLNVQDDTETRQAALHFLKGSALNLGFRDLADLCQQGEKTPRMTAEALARLVACYNASRKAFIKGVGSLSAA